MSIKPQCLDCPVFKKSLFAGIEGDGLAAIEAAKTTSSYRAKQTLFQEGEMPAGVHCIRRGTIKLIAKAEQGKKQILALCTPGEALGISDLSSGNSYAVSAEALEESELCFIPKEILWQQMTTPSALCKNALRLLSHSIRHQVSLLRSQLEGSSRERVARALILLSQTFTGDPAKGGGLTLRVSRQDIASLAGIVMENAVRCLSALRDEGVLQLEGRTIRIAQPDQLRKEASLTA